MTTEEPWVEALKRIGGTLSVKASGERSLRLSSATHYAHLGETIPDFVLRVERTLK